MSSGWLHKFRNRHMIRFRQISGESVSVITTITDEWKHCLPTIVNGYNDNDCIVQMKQHSYLNQCRIDHSFSAKRTAKKASVQKNDVLFYLVGIGVGLTNSSS